MSPPRLAARAAPGRRLIPWLVLSTLTLPALYALWTLVVSIASAPPALELRGVRLGMTPDQVREHFVRTGEGARTGQGARTGEGAFRAQAIGQDLALDWTGESPSPRFEFHAGMLVAVRLVVPRAAPESTGDRLTITSGSVMVREPRSDGTVAITWLARGCPTHAGEVDRLLSHTPTSQR